MIEKWITKIMLNYGMPHEFMCKVPNDTKCISCPNPIELVVCEETFKVGFCLPLYPFVECLLTRHRLVPV